MKELFYAPAPLFNEHLGVVLDEATIAAKEGNEVYFLYNSCCFDQHCTWNMSASSRLCISCKKLMHKALQLLPNNVHILNLEDYWRDGETEKFKYTSAQELKKIEYKGVKIGYSIMSSYISATRNQSPRIDNQAKSYFDALISDACKLTDAIELVLKDIQPDKFYFFNARYWEWRPPYDLSQAMHIDTVSLEMKGVHGGPYVKTRFVNSTPHNVKTQHKLYVDLWNHADVEEQEKVSIGKGFFENRRNGIATNDKVYIANQKQGELPQGWDSTKKNIVIFNSSEDEFASLGDEYDALSLFPSQYQGIKYILESTKEDNDIRVYLRIHPNLSNIPYRYHTELLKLDKIYKHLTIIPGTASISTYALMEAAEKVIVFGSTMGVESAYWGKPVVLLAGAIYYYSDICYVPKTREELYTLLLQKLEPKSNARDEAIKIGFYFMYKDPKERNKYFDSDFEDFGFGKYRWTNIHYLKLLGSSKLYAIFHWLYMKLYKKNSTIGYMPFEEDENAIL